MDALPNQLARYRIHAHGLLGFLGCIRIGAANGGSAKVYVYGNSSTIPFLSVTNCKGNNNSNQSLYPTKAGFLAINIGTSVGPVVGTYYIELWN